MSRGGVYCRRWCVCGRRVLLLLLCGIISLWCGLSGVGGCCGCW